MYLELLKDTWYTWCQKTIFYVLSDILINSQCIKNLNDLEGPERGGPVISLLVVDLLMCLKLLKDTCYTWCRKTIFYVLSDISSCMINSQRIKNLNMWYLLDQDSTEKWSQSGKMPSGGRAEIENVKSAKSDILQFQLCNQVKKYHSDFWYVTNFVCFWAEISVQSPAFPSPKSRPRIQRFQNAYSEDIHVYSYIHRWNYWTSAFPPFLCLILSHHNSEKGSYTQSHFSGGRIMIKSSKLAQILLVGCALKMYKKSSGSCLI